MGAFAAGGITAARDWVQPGGVLTLEGSAGVVQVVAGADRVLPVGFGGAAMAVTAGP